MTGKAIRDAAGPLIAKCVAGGNCVAQPTSSDSGSGSTDNSGSSGSGNTDSGSVIDNVIDTVTDTTDQVVDDTTSAVDNIIQTGDEGTAELPTPAPGSYELSMFYCGFGKDFCGQSTFDDVNPLSTYVILSFVNSQSDGSVVVD